MSMEYIRATYGVPAKRGGRIEYTYKNPSRMGTIIGSKSSKLRIRLDGDAHAGYYHPTWELKFLPETIAA